MTNDFDPVAQEINHSSPGKLLRDAREKLGFTEEQVAKELFMTLTKVRAIEADQFTRLHSDTFIRGYLRAYAQLVKVDFVEVLSIYDTQAKILGLKEDLLPTKKQDVSNRKFWQFTGLLLGVLLLIWLVSIWFLDNRKKNDYSDLNIAVPVSVEPISAGVASTAASSVASVSVGDASVSSQNASMASSSVSAVISTVPTASTLVNSSVHSGRDKLEFYFRDECWVEVSDVNGDILATELKMANTELTVTGQSPFEIKLGNAPAVSLKLNDENVNLVPTLGTNVLTIKLGSRSGQ